jgi:zinc transport system substrate-binding protein
MTKYKKTAFYLICLILGVLCITGCSKKTQSDSGKLQIVTTLFPNYDFAKQIAGDKADVTLLLKPGVEAHDYDPTPSDIIAVNKADLFIYTGENMETWASQVIDAIESQRVTIVDTSAGITLIKTDADEEGEEEDSSHQHQYDPHIWTNPKNAITMVNTILEAIIKKDPANEEYYRKNAEEYIARISEVDSELRDVAQNSKYDTIYFGGRFAMLYFVQEYGLGYLSAFDSCSSETEPSAKLVTNIVEAMKKNNAKVVFYEELTDPKTAQAIADEVDGTALLLHSCHNVSAEDFKNGVTYVDLMEQNVENLKIALGEE